MISFFETERAILALYITRVQKFINAILVLSWFTVIILFVFSYIITFPNRQFKFKKHLAETVLCCTNERY